MADSAVSLLISNMGELRCFVFRKELSRFWALAVAFPVGTARADYNIKTIGSCQTITESWSYAVDKPITATRSDLQRFDPFSACIVIAADNVTLDLQGYTITGPGADVRAFGIATDQDRTGVKVHSGKVRHFDVGVRLSGIGLTVEQINASNNGNGIVVFANTGIINGHRVVANSANQNSGTGIFVTCPSVVLGNVATGNSISQIQTLGVCTYFDNSPLVPFTP
jgi:hypothetical protein